MKKYLRSFRNAETLGQFIRMGVVGGFNTLAFFVMFNLFFLWADLSSFWSVTWAFIMATAMSYVLNRRWTFRIRGRVGDFRESAGFYVINLISWALTAGLVQVGEALWGPLNALQANALLVVATGIIVIPKFAGYRDVVFRRSLDGSADRS